SAGKHKRALERYSAGGYRVISLAGKRLRRKDINLSLSELEKELEHLALIVFENRLKRETQETVKILTEANIQSIMCTGDALLTAISVATECGIVEKHL